MGAFSLIVVINLLNRLRMQTPLFDHLDPDYVYEPREDTFLLLDALEKDLELIKASEPTIICEIGIGSGVILSALSTALGNSCFYMGFDISPHACETTAETFSVNKNGLNFDLINSDLIACLKSSQKFDIVIFNPPYVCCDESEVIDSNNGALDKTWNGGFLGTSTLELLIPQLGQNVAKNGYVYLVAISTNDLKRIDKLMENVGFTKAYIVMQRKIIGEHLHILRFKKL